MQDVRTSHPRPHSPTLLSGFNTNGTFFFSNYFSKLHIFSVPLQRLLPDLLCFLIVNREVVLDFILIRLLHLGWECGICACGLNSTSIGIYKLNCAWSSAASAVFHISEIFGACASSQLCVYARFQCGISLRNFFFFYMRPLMQTLTSTLWLHLAAVCDRVSSYCSKRSTDGVNTTPGVCVYYTLTYFQQSGVFELWANGLWRPWPELTEAEELFYFGFWHLPVFALDSILTQKVRFHCRNFGVILPGPLVRVSTAGTKKGSLQELLQGQVPAWG